jgi:hypothetical protein
MYIRLLLLLVLRRQHRETAAARDDRAGQEKNPKRQSTSLGPLGSLNSFLLTIIYTY